MIKLLLFLYDLAWVAASPFLALLLRHNLSWPSHTYELDVYAAILVPTAAVVFVISGQHRHVWRAASLHDLMRIVIAVSVTLALALVVTFALTRLEGVARSLPIIQWFVILAGLSAGRIVVRLVRDIRANRRTPARTRRDNQQHILIVGTGGVAELYVRAIEKLGDEAGVSIEGFLTEQGDLQRRRVFTYPVLGKPKGVRQVIDDLMVHGVLIERVVVTDPFETLAETSRAALLELERESEVKVDLLLERLVGGPAAQLAQRGARADQPQFAEDHASPGFEPFAHPGYARVKRGVDVVLSAVLIAALSPIALIIAFFVALDVGRPVLFWQQRPGRFRQAFLLYKFRTMRGAHDRHGVRIPEEQRVSSFGAALRRSRLDELPQLFNILAGQMSFVGPRPLLPVDQPTNADLRLRVRPGLTGWAQVMAGRDVAPDTKAALDAWYVRNASLSIDARIALRTIAVVIFGERNEQTAIENALSEETADKGPVAARRRGDDTADDLLGARTTSRAA